MRSAEFSVDVKKNVSLFFFVRGKIIKMSAKSLTGPLRKFLKWRPFVPLSRLTYSAYLVNGLVELHSASTVRVPQYLDNFTLVSLSMSLQYIEIDIALCPSSNPSSDWIL